MAVCLDGNHSTDLHTHSNSTKTDLNRPTIDKKRITLQLVYASE